MRKSTSTRELFVDSAGLVHAATGLGPSALAARLGMSGKSLARYKSGTLPPAPRSRDILQRLAALDLDGALLDRFADALKVDRIAAHPKVAPFDPAAAKAAMNAAVYAAADGIGLVPDVVRAASTYILDAMVAGGVDAATARELLKRPEKGK